MACCYPPPVSSAHTFFPLFCLPFLTFFPLPRRRLSHLGYQYIVRSLFLPSSEAPLLRPRQGLAGPTFKHRSTASLPPSQLGAVGFMPRTIQDQPPLRALSLCQASPHRLVNDLSYTHVYLSSTSIEELRELANACNSGSSGCSFVLYIPVRAI